ncbi:hypothetical protein BGX26_002018 [Mortierella sp. AD094]|nr:hypothetical protein BGX26_002018 [Mortierella sp. AD094]
MKAFKTLFVVGITCLQLLSGSQAQNTTKTSPAPTNATTTTTVAAGSSTTSAGVSTPTPPVFANTPGLQVSLFDQMAVVQNTVLSMSISLTGQRSMGSINVSVAKKDGSSNNTVVSATGSFISTTQVWNVTAAQYPLGDYLVNIIVTPNNTAILPTTSGSAPSTTTTSVTQPIVTPSAAGPNVYYWQGVVRVTAPRNTTIPSSAMGMKFDRVNSGSGFVTMFIASGIVVLGSLLAL